MTSDANYIDTFSACLSEFGVFIRNWSACFEKASFLSAGSYCNPAELIFFANLHISFCRHAEKKFERNQTTACRKTGATTLNFVVLMRDSTGLNKNSCLVMR